MSSVVTPLTPHIGGEITGISGDELVDRRVADECLAALEQYATGTDIRFSARTPELRLQRRSHLRGEVRGLSRT